MFTLASVGYILILCPVLFWLGWGGWVARWPVWFSFPSQTSFSLPCLGGWRATWLGWPACEFPNTWLVFVLFHPRLKLIWAEQKEISMTAADCKLFWSHQDCERRFILILYIYIFIYMMNFIFTCCDTSLFDLWSQILAKGRAQTVSICFNDLISRHHDASDG